MPKLIDYPRTNYTGAWELSEVIDNTGGMCTIETTARKLNRKVSGSFKAIIGSAVKFGLVTSKRELLTTTTLFKRIKHSYDKSEEIQFHREAFLNPPLFLQLYRKFRNRELPIQMLDVMLIREFNVEEINAQGVAKTFIDGSRMCGLLNEQNIIINIEEINNSQIQRRELANISSILQNFTTSATVSKDSQENTLNNEKNASTVGDKGTSAITIELFNQTQDSFIHNSLRNEEESLRVAQDTVSNLFGIVGSKKVQEFTPLPYPVQPHPQIIPGSPTYSPQSSIAISIPSLTPRTNSLENSIKESYQMQVSGPGVNTSLDIIDEDDLAIAIAVLEKVRRQLKVRI